MNNQNTAKIRQSENNVNINLGMIFFGVVLIYIIVCVFMFLTTKHISSYQVKKGTLFVNNIYTGLALRDETMINSNYVGYLNYYIREGTRIGTNKMVCTVDEGGKLNDLINEQNMGQNTLSDRVLNEIRDDIMEYKKSFNPQNFATVYDFKYTLEGNVLKDANSSILNNLDKLNRSGDSGLINICNSPVSGIVVYFYDGYENFSPEEITSEILKKENYQKTQLMTNKNLINKGDPIYKLITKENWSLLIETDAERADYLLEKEYVKVKFLKNQNVSWAEVKLITNKEGKNFIQLLFNNSMITFCTERFVDIELVLEEEEGLKVPNSAIVQKDFFVVPEEYVSKSGPGNENGVLKEVYDEDGNKDQVFTPVTIYSKAETEYYIDSADLKMGDTLQKSDSNTTITLSKKGNLVGVYNKNKGYADFKQIQVLYQNDEYSIVKPNTEYGLFEYDYIVLDAEAVSENEVFQ